jgi:multisubunit Na+/H+ antiporter MnhB subunit
MNKLKTVSIIILILVLVITVFVLFNYSESDNSTAEYYVENSEKDTAATNAVTAIYLNYRVYDSIFETLILLVSVSAVIHFSWRKDHE